jgi:hypothetical protein
MRVSNEPIPIENFNIWYQLFCTSGCRFISNPIEYRNRGEVRVCYQVDDMHEFNEFYAQYLRLIKPIKETKQSWLKRLKRKVSRGIRVIK